MAYPIDRNYYTNRKAELLDKLEQDIRYWSPLILKDCGEIQPLEILREARNNFADLIPQIPYIGGDENNLTKNLVESVRYLALYEAMKNHGKTAAAAGKIIYDTYLIKSREPQPPLPTEGLLTPEQLMERRKTRAAKSQVRHYPGDYVYTFIAGDGKNFDYGYDFTECASHKFYLAHNAEEFLPYYCYLDVVAGQASGFGFTRTRTLYEGHGKCNHRFKIGGKTEAPWPPSFSIKKKR